MLHQNKLIDLYYWPTPNGWKVSIALEEMMLPYKVHEINISKGEQYNKNFLKISPNNRIPAITDFNGPDGKPISLFESGAIIHYLGCKTALFIGNNDTEYHEIMKWLMWQMGGLGPMAGHHDWTLLKSYPTHSHDMDWKSKGFIQCLKKT